jgi:hypothetical protein
MSAFIRPENLQICFKSGLCSFLALHSRVSNFFWFQFDLSFGQIRLRLRLRSRELDCSSIAWLLLLLHTDVVTI